MNIVNLVHVLKYVHSANVYTPSTFLCNNMYDGDVYMIKIGKNLSTSYPNYIKGNNISLNYQYIPNDSRFVILLDDSTSFTIYHNLMDINSDLEVNGACTATSHPTSSDLRLKKNINEITNDKSNEIIDNIKVYSFNLKSDSSERTHYGVIAQELQNIAPELVYEDKSDEKYLSVNYTELIPHMINKIHQQEKIISDLTEKMNKIYELLEINI